MTNDAPETQTVVIERDLPHPPARIWRALTQPALMAEWLMSNDFQPVAGHCFELRGDWGAVACRVLEIEPARHLVYSWQARGLESVVTWTLTPIAGGTRLRMEQSGFRPDQQQAFLGAQYGWPKFLAALEHLLARAD